MKLTEAELREQALALGYGLVSIRPDGWKPLDTKGDGWEIPNRTDMPRVMYKESMYINGDWTLSRSTESGLWELRHKGELIDQDVFRRVLAERHGITLE